MERTRVVAPAILGLGLPQDLNHSWCYEIEGDQVRTMVNLDDNFGWDVVRIERLEHFCNPECTGPTGFGIRDQLRGG